MNSDELKAKRTLYNLTQLELGELVGYPSHYAKQRISDYEHGRRNMGLTTLYKFNRIFEELNSKVNI